MPSGDRSDEKSDGCVPRDLVGRRLAVLIIAAIDFIVSSLDQTPRMLSFHLSRGRDLLIRCKYEPVQLKLMGRTENFDVIELPESVPNLLGQVPLEVLDLVVDSKGQKLIANPAHGGEQMTEEY
jgi:hypothetical protein